MKRFRVFHLSILVAALLGVAHLAAGAQPVTTSMQLPLAGTVFVPLSNGGFDAVALAGQAHVVTHVIPPGPFTPPNPVRIHVNLDQVFGVGDITGLRYNATGANRINLPAIPRDPVNLGFNLQPDGPPVTPPNPIIPLDISFILTFNPDTGALSNVVIESMSVPV
ncbi:MAG TPA: hypothetical protein VNM15_08510, partial [Candidatus Binatia bacterium]|nr:hypothetical protein [Candidatus Binatia bacterium]